MVCASKLSLNQHTQKVHDVQKRRLIAAQAAPPSIEKSSPLETANPIESRSNGIIPLEDILNYYNYGHKTEAIEKSIFSRKKKKRKIKPTKNAILDKYYLNHVPTFSHTNSSKKSAKESISVSSKCDSLQDNDYFTTYKDISSSAKNKNITVRHNSEDTNMPTRCFTIKNSFDFLQHHNEKRKQMKDLPDASHERPTSNHTEEKSWMKADPKGAEDSMVPEYSYVSNSSKNEKFMAVHLDDDQESSRYYSVKSRRSSAVRKFSSNLVKVRTVLKRRKSTKQPLNLCDIKRSLMISRLAEDPSKLAKLRAMALWRLENQQLIFLHNLMNKLPLSEPEEVPDLFDDIDRLMKQLEEEEERALKSETRQVSGLDEDVIDITSPKRLAPSEFFDNVSNNLSKVQGEGNFNYAKQGSVELKLGMDESVHDICDNDGNASAFLVTKASVGGQENILPEVHDLNQEFFIIEEEETSTTSFKSSTEDDKVTCDITIKDSSKQVLDPTKNRDKTRIQENDQGQNLSNSTSIRTDLVLKEAGDEYIIEINNDLHDTYEELKNDVLPEQEELLPEKAPAVKLKGIKRKVEEGPKKKKNKKHDVNLSKSEVITDDQPSKADKETNAIPKRRKKNVYVDMKLARVPDLNPYAKKAQSFRKNRRSEVEEAAEENLEEEIQVNVRRSVHEPYCNICEILLERTPSQNLAMGHEAKINESTVPIPQQSMVWIPRPESTLEGTTDKPFPVSRLLVCSRCKVCVHEVCYGAVESENWMCDKCALPEKKTATCYICKRTGGALKKTSGGEFFHFRCAVLIPELSRLSDIDLNLIPAKRWNLRCLICDRSGTEPAVHCMASRECQLSFHISCAETHAMDCVLGPENAVILRCAFCVEKFKLKEEEEITENKFPPQVPT